MAASLHMEPDRDYDARLLRALPSALSLFPRAALDQQFREMAKQKRALCFTLIVSMPPLAGAAIDIAADRRPGRTAAVLVCLHVAPKFAALGSEALVDLLTQATRGAPEPLHELCAPIARVPVARASGFYREAVYPTGSALYIAITTHSPVEIPPETAEIVEQVTRGAAVDMVTTVSITADRPDRSRIAAAEPHSTSPRPTIH